MAKSPTYELGLPGDYQIFEYDKTLSLEIPDGQRHLGPGDVVVINKDNAIAGILTTYVKPAVEPAVTSRLEVLTRKTYGLNGPNHASVRVRTGVFERKVTVKAGLKVGDPVYVKAATGNSGAPALSFDKANADLVIGWLYKAPATNSGEQNVQIVLDPKAV